MSIPDQNRVRELLRPHEDALTGTVKRAWDRWWGNHERALLYRRTRACLMHNYMMLDAIPGLPQSSDAIKAVERPSHETALFLVGDELVIRFKKGDENGKSSNIGTQTALDFNDPDEAFNMFGLKDPARVDVAYVLNELETMVEDVLIVARDNERVIWSYSIAQRADDIQQPTILPTDPQQPPPADTGMRLPEADEVAKKKGTDGAQ